MPTLNSSKPSSRSTKKALNELTPCALETATVASALPQSARSFLALRNGGQDVHILLEAAFNKLQEILVRKARDQLKHGGFGGVPGREALAQCELPFGTPKIKVRVEMPQARLVCLKGHRDHISIGKKLGPNLQVYQQTTSSCKEETLYPESTGIENL